MFLINFISQLLDAATQSAVLEPLAIILSTFILEDPATILVGILAADKIIPLPEAILSLYAGIVLGDFALYGLGRLAVTHPFVDRLVQHRHLTPYRKLLTNRLGMTVFTTRFIPGARLPTYTACGFFKMPFIPFAVSIILATSIWTTLLFIGAYLFGNLTSDFLGFWRWPIGIGLILAILFFERRSIKKRLASEKTNGDNNV